MHSSSVIGRWLPVVLWASVIFAFSSLPQTQVGGFFLTDFIIKKTAHVSEYAILFALIYRATKGKLLLAFALTIFYAATDEFHQSFVPGRTAKVYDVIGFDLAGASIAAYVLWKLKQLRKKKQ